MLILWEQGYFPNYILTGNIKKGSIVWVHGGGEIWDGCYDTSIPHDVIIKPKGKIKIIKEAMKKNDQVLNFLSNGHNVWIR